MSQAILDHVLVNFRRAAERLGTEVDAEMVAKLTVPEERIEIALGPQFRDGQVHLFRAFIVRHATALGPAKGGIRMTPCVTLDDVNGLAMEMTW